MALVEKLVERRESLENPATPIKNAWDIFRGDSSSSGINVTEKRALSSTAVLSAIRLLAENSATLPLPVYNRLGEGEGREAARDHYLWPVLNGRPNPEMSAVSYREAMMVHLLMWGDHFAEIVTDGAGQVTELWPLLPDRTKRKRDSAGNPVIVTRIDGRERALPFERVLHIPGISTDGRNGWGLIDIAREAIGLTLATEKFGAKFFGSGSHLGGWIKHPETMSDTAEKHLRSSWEQMHTGLDNAHRVAILEEGAEFNSIGVPPEAAQFLETRKFQVGEIARLFRVPNHMIGDLDRATFSNIEQQSLEFVVYSLRSWLVRIEKAISNQLLTDSERQTVFVEHNVDGLLRGDTETRFNAYQQAINHGWMSPNEARSKENMNPIEGGDRYFVRRDLIPLDQADALAMPAPRDAEPEQRDADPHDAEQRAIDGQRAVVNDFLGVFEDSIGRMVRAEVQELRSNLRRLLAEEGVAGWLRFLDFFYTDEDEMASIIGRTVPASFRSMAKSMARVAGEDVGRPLSDMEIRTFLEGERGYLPNFVKRYSASSRRQLAALTREAQENPEDVDPQEAVEGRLDEWVEGTDAGRPRAERWADRETNRLGNAIAKETFAAAGVALLVWRTIGDSCPYCNAMAGRVVGVRGTFLGKGERFQPEGVDTPLRPSSSIGHPPLHPGCDCVVRPN